MKIGTNDNFVCLGDVAPGETFTCPSLSGDFYIRPCQAIQREGFGGVNLKYGSYISNDIVRRVHPVQMEARVLHSKSGGC